MGHQILTPPASWTRDCEVVVVGTGAAGLSAVVALVSAGIDVAVVTRGEIADSSTDWAQGGLAAVWSPADSVGLHLSDTLVAGAGLCDEDAVADLVSHAPGALRRLIRIGAHFDTDDQGRIDLHLEGGHHARRILHAGGDQSGHEVERALAESLRGRLRVLTGTRLIDVLTDAAGRACGVSVLDEHGETGRISAPAVVLATGGIGQLWPTTTNPAVSTGDGLAASLRAGATVRDAEFMQFHPTILVVPPTHRIPGDRGVLISEAVRGEGAVLIDHRGRRVMTGIHPQADLAPRDVVSAAEQAHMSATGEDHLFLDATAFGSSRWQACFPSILQMCRERGVDPVTEPIPVRPGAHYHCGGVAASMSGITSVPGLRVVGEVACTGVQGANRLASNSLTEALVMGERAAHGLVAEIGSGAHPDAPVDRPTAGLVAASGVAEIRGVMARHVSVLRDAAGLAEALTAISGLPGADRLDDTVLNATNAATAATLVATAAARRTESRGCHRRSDVTGRRPDWRLHIDQWLDDEARPALALTEPVQDHQEAA